MLFANQKDMFPLTLCIASSSFLCYYLFIHEKETVMNSKRKKNWLLRIIVFFAILFVVIVFLLPPLSTGHDRHNPRLSCTYRLKQIGLSLKQYAMDYEYFFPLGNNAEGLEKLRATDYLTDYGCYVCPGTKTERGRKGSIIKENCDYIYLGGFKADNGDNIPLAFDKPDNHNDYFNVLFLDGHVVGYPTSASGSCEEIIIFLNNEHKYPDKLFKQLLSKAKKIDSNLHFY